MDCEFTVELSADDPTLAVPWRSPDGQVVYIDLKAHPEAIDELEEVRAFPELGELLRAINAGPLATAKCDAWFDTLMDVDDEPYAATWKCASYVDIFFADDRKFAPFEVQERLAREAVQRLRSAGDLPARCELTLRRAYFDNREGLYWTVYAFGYGGAHGNAREAWHNCLKTIGRWTKQIV